MDKYAVVGNPIAHSKSPDIHAAFAKQTGESLSYEKMLLSLDTFERDIESMLRGKEYRGFNVTVPFKERAWKLCEHLSNRAKKAAAVNTLYLNEAGQISGENTDGAGMCRDICINNSVQLKGKKILLLGAGGAVRGVIPAILEYEPAWLVIANRTYAKAQQLQSIFQEDGPVDSKEFKDLSESFDIIINGTSASLHGELPPLPEIIVSSNTVAYDMMYGSEKTVFNRWATAKGAAHAIDGLGMLVEQAAESFFIWRGIRPDTQEVIAKLRKGSTE